MIPGESFDLPGIICIGYGTIPLSAAITEPSPPNSLTTSIGIPIGLTKNANRNRIAPFVTEPVNNTAAAITESKLLAILKSTAEQEISPAHNQINKLTTEVMSMTGTFSKIFIAMPSLSFPNPIVLNV